MIIREMTIDDYDEVYEMWQITTKRALSKADEKDQMERYLKHNAGMSQVAVVDGKIVGTVLAGHDGRRGFIHHMAVLPEFRRKKIGHALAQTAIQKIREQGIDKTHIFCYQIQLLFAVVYLIFLTPDFTFLNVNFIDKRIYFRIIYFRVIRIYFYKRTCNLSGQHHT